MNWTIILLVGALLPSIVVGQTNPINPILGNINSSVGAIGGSLQSFSAETTLEISNFLGKHVGVIRSEIANVTEKVGTLTGTQIAGIGDISRRAVNDISDQTSSAVSGLANIANILSFGILRNLRGFPDSTPTESERVVLMEALNTFQDIITRMTLGNIRPLLDRYNDWAGSGLISGIATLLMEPRQKLVKAIGKPTSVLCGVQNDTSGKLLPAQANATLALNSIRSTAQSVIDDCDGLSCLLLVPTAQQVVRDCNC